MKKIKWIIFGVIVFVTIRAFLPYLLENRINRQLDSIDGYHGSVEDVDLALYRGGFKIHELKIFEEQSLTDSVPIVNLTELDFSIEWRALFKGKFVGEVYLTQLDVNLVKREKVEAEEEKSSRKELIKTVQTFNPIQINIFEIKSGSLKYADPSTNPEISIELDSIYLKAENLRNVRTRDKDLPASAKFRSSNKSGMKTSIDADLNYLSSPPDFDVDIELEKLDVNKFNEATEAYANLDVESGHFNLFMEMKAENGQVEGYSKPIIKNLKIAPADSGDSFLNKAYEKIVQAGVELLENGEKDQIASRISISGSLQNQDAELLGAIWNLFKNAFIEAFAMKLEHSIQFESEE